MSNRNDVKQNITSLSQDDWDETDLKVKIIDEILEARKKQALSKQIIV